MKKTLQLIMGLLLVFGLSETYAQSKKTITGSVKSSEDGSALPGVTVQVLGSNTYSQTNASGEYKIEVPSSASTLRFSSIGFVMKDIKIGTSSKIDLALETDLNLLEAVVVSTGYGPQRKDRFAGAATILGTQVTENRPVGSFTQMLQGKAPGVLVNSGSGQPGANASITIRGVKSIAGAGSQPLYVIDGIPIDANTFYSLNPNDFESVTILKDANAAALYGARGGVGVVVITTKQGKIGETNYTARYQTGITAPPDFSRLNLMSSSELLAYEERIGLVTKTTSQMPGWTWSRNNPANATKSEDELKKFDQNLDKLRNTNTPLSDYFFRTGTSKNYELNASGGSEKLRFFASGSVFDQKGIDKTSSLTRYTGRYNLMNNNKKLSIHWNNLISYAERINAVGDLYGNSSINPFQMIYRAKPYDNPYLEDGTLNFGGGGTNLALKSVANTLESNMHSRDNNKQMKLNSGLTLAYDLYEGLTLKNVSGIDASNTLRETYIDPGTYRGSLQQPGGAGYARESNYISAQLINTTSLNYTRKISTKHSFNTGAYFEVIRGYNKGMGFQLYNLNSSLLNTGQGAVDLPTNSATTYPQRASSARSGFGIRSYFFTGEYTFDDKITINANVRRDGTSRIFNESNKEITTWSAGAVWNVIREGFMKNQSVLSNARLRFSIGKVPNIGSIGTSSYGIYGSSVPNYAGTQLPAFGTTSYSGSTLPGLFPSSPGNPNLKIETVQKMNLGVDLGFLKERARLMVDLYDENTLDLFVRQPLSATTAFASLDINAGKMNNKGIEFSADFDIIKKKGFNVGLNFNHGININTIKDLGLVEEYFLGTFVIRKGLAYGTHYTYNYLGANPENGRPTYETADGGTTTDFAKAGQFAKFGTYLPKHVGGFGLNADYRGFYVMANFAYQFDVVRSNNTRNWITDGTVGYASAVNQSRELIDNQWQKPGDQKFFPSPAFAKNFTSSDLEDAKFLRFRTLNVGYNIPAVKFKGKTAFKGANVYANFQNLAIWSKWTGVDPEDDNNISLVEYPNPKAVVFGIDLKF